MLKVKAPKHLFLEGGDEAVLLLHSFTGTVQDVKEVAEALHKDCLLYTSDAADE